MRGLSYVLWTFLQMFSLKPQYTCPHSPPCHTCICRSLHFSVRWCLYLCSILEVLWWWWLHRNTFLYHVFCTCFCSSHSYLSCRAQLCKACCCYCLYSCHWCYYYLFYCCSSVLCLPCACEFSTKFILFSKNIDLVSHTELQTEWEICML